MAALQGERTSSIRKITRDLRPLAANAKAWKGALAVCEADGFYAPATNVAGLVVVGRFYESVDNTGGADGAKSADIHFFRERKLFLLKNDTVNAVVVADRERQCFALDDQTVSGDDTKSPVGIVYDVTSEGVWVEVAAPTVA